MNFFPKKFKSSLYLLSPLLFFMSLYPTHLSFAGEIPLGSLQAKIHEQKAEWQAGETALSKLSIEQKKKRLGLNKRAFLPSEMTSGQLALSPAPEAASAPASLDYRVYGYVTPARDQGSCGSCWAFGSIAALESQLLINKIEKPSATTDDQINLSEQTLVSCDTSNFGCEGGDIGSAGSYLLDFGVPSETCFPYTEENTPCEKACPKWQNTAYKPLNIKLVTDNKPTVKGLKNALISYGPLVTTLIVYEDFFNYESGVYSLADGQFIGHHAVLLVGYDDAEKAFIVKNSWGPYWGMNGFFKIAYSQVANSVAFGEYSLAYIGAQKLAYTKELYPQSAEVPYTESNNTFELYTDPNEYDWTARSQTPWIVLLSNNKGTGNTSVGYKVLPNTTKEKRKGRILIAGETFTVFQAAPPAETKKEADAYEK